MGNHSVDELLKGVHFKIAAIREARRRFSTQLAPDFNLFDYLRTDEIGISRIVADLLEPNGSHGQGDVFLRLFATMVKQEWISSTSNWHVVTEQQANDRRRIDVYLESSLGVVGIENKPWATDQWQQLTDYAQFLEQRVKNTNRRWLLIYLCNSAPSENSIAPELLDQRIREKNLVLLTFHELTSWLDACAVQTKAPTVRIFIEELSKFVRIDINGVRDMSEEREVIDEITKSSENMAAAFQVSNVMVGLKQDLLERFRESLERELEAEGFYLAWDPGMSKEWGCWVGFGIKMHLDQEIGLRFEFERAGLNSMLWGVCRERDSVTRSDEIWSRISGTMNSKFWPSRGDINWAWYSAIPDPRFDKEYMHWGTSARPWIAMSENGEDRLVSKIVRIAKEVHQAFDGHYDWLRPTRIPRPQPKS